MKISHYLEFGRRIARSAGRLLVRMADNFGRIRYKTNSANLVTAADRRAEQLIIKTIRNKYPTHSILAEETGAGGEKDGVFQWLVDPLDGTTNYAHQLPLWAVSLALTYRREVIIGVVYQPVLDELYEAVKGQGSFCNGKRLKVSRVNRIQNSLLVTGIPYSAKNKPRDNFINFQRFSKYGQAVRRLGSASIDLCYVAQGRFDGYWERDLNPWDVAAGALVLTEAGGKITDFKGNPYQIYQPAETLASNGLIHRAMISLINQ